jgi:hypothetical protein
MILRGVSFLWRTDEHEDKNFDSGRHYRVIAQETEEVLPEVVMEVAGGEKAVAYSEISPAIENWQGAGSPLEGAEWRSQTTYFRSTLFAVRPFLRSK